MHLQSSACAWLAALGVSLGVLLATPAAAQSRPAPRDARPAADLPPPRETRVETDGEKAVGLWGLAYFGAQTFRFGDFNGSPNNVDVYTLGVRHWIPGAPGTVHNWGIDAGVGLALSDISHEAVVAGTPVTYKASARGLSLHAGLPVTLARARHLNFIALPEVDLLYATGNNDYPGPTRTKWTGSGVGLGARAGFELFFGFLGMDRFALQGTLGAALRFSSMKSKLGATELKDSTWRLGTDRPLGFIVGNIAAIYYY